MKMTRWLLLTTLLIGLTTGCGEQSTPDDGDDVAQNGKSDAFGEADENVVKTWDLDALADEGFREDPRAIQGARVEGDELVLDVQYGGGCKDHDWRLHWDGLILESFPAQANLTLYHNSNDDFCEALGYDELRFDISGLAGGEIILNLTGTEHSVSYVGEGGAAAGAKKLHTGDSQTLEDGGFRPDGASITHAAVDGDTLTLDVSYGGGCEEHEFELHWDGLVLESFPPQVNLTLYHNSNNDFCEAFLHETLTFDISQLGGGDLIINLAGSEISLTLGDSAPAPAAQPIYTDDPEALSLQGFRSAGRIIGDAAIEEGNLVLDVSYGGGCEEHEFELAWDGTVLESFPAQVVLTLHHNSNGDACEAFLSERLVFDLETLGGGPLIINLADSEVASVMLEE